MRTLYSLILLLAFHNLLGQSSNCQDCYGDKGISTNPAYPHSFYFRRLQIHGSKKHNIRTPFAVFRLVGKGSDGTSLSIRNLGHAGYPGYKEN